jgi:hypothetical protein
MREDEGVRLEEPMSTLSDSLQLTNATGTRVDAALW